jgi:transcription elongation factor GreA-like protein
MREEFEKMVAAGKLDRQHVDALVALTQSGYCMHRSWGFGRIRTMDTVFARFTIDFANKPGHLMDLAFAATSLKPIPKEHILARKAQDLEGLRQLAAANHLELIRIVLHSFGGRATADQIQQVLVPDVITADWRKWGRPPNASSKKTAISRSPPKRPTRSFTKWRRSRCRTGCWAVFARPRA